MNVKLISYTQPTLELFKQGVEDISDLIAFCARVSNPSNQLNTETSDKLISYLAKHRHWSPFEMVHATVEVETTRDIARQMLRHRSFAFQEFSQRYADPTKDLEFVTREARLQDTKNRQNSLPSTDFTLGDMWTIHQNKVLKQAIDAYKWAIDNGIAKEQARAVLPEGLTVSRLYMSGSIRSFIHFVDVRTEAGTQKEHREVAKEVANVISKLFVPMKDYIRS